MRALQRDGAVPGGPVLGPHPVPLVIVQVRGMPILWIHQPRSRQYEQPVPE